MEMINFKTWLEMTRWKREGFPNQKVTLQAKMQQYPNDFVSFRDMPKIGLNPQPRDSETPAGIYAFPVSIILNGGQDNLGMFGSERYVYIIKPKNGVKLLEIKNSQERDIYNNIKNSVKTFPKSGALTANLRRAGYNGVVDWGTRTIHSIEPYQAVFFGEQTIDVLEMFLNPDVAKFKGTTIMPTDNSSPF
jgi:hypothetical protein